MIGLFVQLGLIILFIIPLLKRKTPKDIFVIWGLYFISSLTSLFFDPSDLLGFRDRDNYNNFDFILYGLLICYSLSPLYAISKIDKRPRIEKYFFSKGQNYILTIVIIGGIFSIIYSFPYALESLAKGAKEVRSKVLRSDETVLPLTIYTTIAVAFSTFFSIYLAFFFLSLKSNLKFIKKVLLFLSSCSYLIISLCYTARDGFIFFIIMSGILVLIYWKSFSKKMKRIAVFCSVLAIIIAGSYLISVTKDRFEENPMVGVYAYISTQPYVFAENIERRGYLGGENYYGLSLRFPLALILTGQQVNEIQRTEPYEWTFGTFLTDFFNVNGLSGLFFLTIIFTEFFRYQFRRKVNNTISFNLTYILYIHYIISGLFYFRLGSFSGNVFFLTVVILIVFQNKLKRDKTKIGMLPLPYSQK